MTEIDTGDLGPADAIPPATSDDAPDGDTLDGDAPDSTAQDAGHDQPPTAAAASPGPPPPPLSELPRVLEALLFVSDGPVEEIALARVLGVRRREVDRALATLAEELRGSGLRVQAGPEGVQLVSAPDAARYVEHYLGLESARRLSNASLETLAVIAYRQPVTRAQVEAIRGVNSDAAVATLKARGLIAESGRAEGPGRPALFTTTQRFLEHFGLERPEDLPPLPGELTAGIDAGGRQLPLTSDTLVAPHPSPGRRVTDSAEQVAAGTALAARPALALAAVAQRALRRRPTLLPTGTGPAAAPPATLPRRETRLPTVHTRLPGGPARTP